MNWKRPKNGDRRTVNRFAFLPTALNDDHKVIWLEWYKRDDEYWEGVFHPSQGWFAERYYQEKSE